MNNDIRSRQLKLRLSTIKGKMQHMDTSKEDFPAASSQTFKQVDIKQVDI